MAGPEAEPEQPRPRVEVIDELLAALMADAPSSVYELFDRLDPTPEEAMTAQSLMLLSRDLDERLRAGRVRRMWGWLVHRRRAHG